LEADVVFLAGEISVLDTSHEKLTNCPKLLPRYCSRDAAKAEPEIEIPHTKKNMVMMIILLDFFISRFLVLMIYAAFIFS
jgi:hypothetical protein